MLDRKQKEKRIKALPSLFKKYIWREYELFYCVEYHKKAADKHKPKGQKRNNWFAPHVHGIITTHGKCNHDNIIDYLKSNYGKKLDYYLKEDPEEVEGWKQYCQKELLFNETETKVPHKFEYHENQADIREVKEEDNEFADIDLLEENNDVVKFKKILIGGELYEI